MPRQSKSIRKENLRLVPQGLKRCGKCLQVLPVDSFSVRKSAKPPHKAGEILSSCKQCAKADTKSRYPRQLELHRYNTYGLAPEEFNDMLSAQGGACAICRDTDVRWFVDHDHNTGKVRGILCRGCNSALGFAKDSPAILLSCAEYLERYGYYGNQ